MPEADSERVTVTTYVPTDQRDRWRADAEALDMSQSEFVRAMVQAGRRGFSLGADTEEAVETDVAGANPRGSDLRTAILELLEREGELGWSDLVEELLGDLEGDVEAELIALQGENRIRHSPRRGTYALAGDADGQ